MVLWWWKWPVVESSFVHIIVNQQNTYKTRISRFSAYALAIPEYTALAAFGERKLEVSYGHFLHEHINYCIFDLLSNLLKI